MNALKIYKSSAGSGKTFTLVKEYLRILLQNPDDYRSILAITFTNKAADEMKSRIVEALVDLSENKVSQLQKDLTEELPGVPLQKNAVRSLQHILHDYSTFSVSTIDSFFHRILRSLARELNLPLKMEVQVALDEAVMDVTDRLLKEVGVDKELTNWLINLAVQKIDDDKGWYIEYDIQSVARELFKEERIDQHILSREKIHEVYEELKKTKRFFENKMQSIGKKAIECIEDNGYTVTDFAYGKTGVANYFYKIAAPYCEDYNLTSRALTALEGAAKWIKKDHPDKAKLTGLTDEYLLPLLNEAANLCNEKLKEYITAGEILKKIFLFGIVNDLQKKFGEYRTENNLILLADTTRLLGEMIDDTDAPFVYEKSGNRYKYLLIDEFQDTSLMQWKNLLPLVTNALGSGFMTLVVGDAKQSIYRWRGGNMNLLIRDIFVHLNNFKSIFDPKVLSTNFRSKKEIVEFNNAFFETAPGILNSGIPMNDHPILDLAYGEDLKQKVAERNAEGGYVRIEFLDKEDAEDDSEESTGWKEIAKNKLLENVRTLLDAGYNLRDIAILVRKNTEGNDIAQFLLDNGIDKIISPDSLLISASPRISFIVNIFRYLLNTTNTIARSEIVYYYSRFIINKTVDDWNSIFSDHLKNRKKKKPEPGTTLFDTNAVTETLFNKILPEKFTSGLNYLAKMPVYELSEQIIGMFNLNENPDAYIQRFQDLVLEYSASNNSSLDGFIKWWDTSPAVTNCSVIVPADEDAIRIMTVHRSKGLQFPVVIMPFAEWSILPKTNSTVWMQSNEKPYDELGKVALPFSKKLENSSFKEPYREEVNQSVIDNLNLLYVAFTRAEEKLLIYSKTDNGKDLNNINKLIRRSCDVLEPTGAVFERGNFDPPAKGKSKQESNSVQLKSYPSRTWHDKLSLKSHAADLKSMTDASLSSINYGILIHAILAEINSPEEADAAVDKLVYGGLISTEEKQVIKAEVEQLLSSENIKPFFIKGQTSMTERDILLPDGTKLRPDKVILKDKMATIIDFKTGVKRKVHESQLRQYAEVMKKMGYENVESYLIYLEEAEVMPVSL